MSQAKSQIKIAAINDIGAKMDDRLESAISRCSQSEGAAAALSQAMKAIENLMPHIDSDINAGKFDIGDKGPLAIGELVKRWVVRSMGAVESMRNQAQADIIRTRGMVEGLQSAVAIAKQAKEVEAKKAEAIAAADAGEVIGERPVGTRPDGNSAASDIAARKVEAKIRKAMRANT